MKRFLTLIPVILIALMATGVACGDDDDPPVVPTPDLLGRLTPLPILLTPIPNFATVIAQIPRSTPVPTGVTGGGPVIAGGPTAVPPSAALAAQFPTADANYWLVYNGVQALAQIRRIPFFSVAFPGVESSLTLLETMGNCISSEGIADARLYVSRENISYFGAMVIVSGGQGAVSNILAVARCASRVIGGGPGAEIQPCLGRYKVPTANATFYVAYAGSNQFMCNAMTAHHAGLRAEW